MVSTLVSIPGYRITEELYNGSRTIVVRGYRETDSLKVVIKLLKNPYPSFSELLSFRNQYTITKNLNSPLIVQTYSLEPYQNGYAMVMEDFGGVSLKEWGVRKTQQSLQEFLVLAIALCNALDVLYRERIIHKDIKPANILINPETKQVKLIDFSIASLLPRETQTLVNPNVLEGTLAYISPEQTGRMNRGIDYRNDFYSVGVTFYELLTGELPFASNDPMELVHSHIAKLPEQLSSRREKEIPQVLSDIVMKLMAKNAEDRYQSALGLKFDLEKCLHQLQETGIIKYFEIRQRDVCDRFLIPEKLYGREQEVQTLLEAFGRVANGASELMLVAGFSGIGKTVVVNEVHKLIVRQRGYFIKGKFDQFNRNIPFSAFVQAFRDLMGQLLSESDEQLEQWKDKILSALGENGQVLIEVIPELEQIIGKQSPAPELSGSAAQNRFNLLFHKFVAVFTTPAHPLVMFLDDLQWADSASLNLMQVLMSQPEAGYLLLIGAYRDNEVLRTHPLMLMLEDIKKASATLSTLTLTPLHQTHINRLIADTFSCSIELALPFTELVYQKAKGNPFFTTQFLKALYEDGLISFDWDTGEWQCDVAQVRSLSLTDDVVEFMALQLQKLPAQTQGILKLAACVGAQFDLETLAIISEQSPTETASALWKALQEGFVIPTNEIYKFYQGEAASIQPSAKVDACAYRFLHDRVQQAAYFLIPEQQRQITHLKIGRILLKNTASADLEEKIFAILNQINYGVNLLTDESEREFITQLNLKAAQKAKGATAYESALKFLQTGKALLSNRSWETHYALTHSLYTTLSEVEYLNGSYKQAEEWVDLTLKKSTSILDRATVYRIKLQLHTAQLQLNEAINVGLVCLRELNINLELHPPQKQQLQVEIVSALPLMTDPYKQAAMEVLITLISPAYIQQPELLAKIINTMLHLSIQYGNSRQATYAYALYGMILCATMVDIDRGYQLGQMAMDLVETLDAKVYKARVMNIFGNCVRHWQKPAQEDLDLGIGVRGFYSGLETGDAENAGYAIIHHCIGLFFLGLSLPDLKKKFDDYWQILKQLKQEYASNYLDTGLQTILVLKQNDFSQFDLPEYLKKNKQVESDLIAGQNLTTLFLFYVLNTLFLYMIGRYQKAVSYATLAVPHAVNAPGLITVSQHNFYYSLALLAQYSDAEESQKTEFLKIVDHNQQSMKIWTNHAPENFLHQYELVEAERARKLGQTWQAAEYYDRAISGAKKNGYTHEAALANELAAKFYLEWGKDRIAQEYLTEAYYGYARWGAKVKVADLEHRYPQLLAPILQQTHSVLSVNETLFAARTMTSTSSSSRVSDSLDLAAILKASQTLLSEIKLDKLLSSLLHTIVQISGADKCVLMLLEDDQLMVQASAVLTASAQIEAQVQPTPLPVQDSREIAISLINTVKRSLQPVVIIDATVHPQFAGDAYIQTRQPKSILCSPILHQGKLLGMVYLENNLATGAFTGDRVELLTILCAQAAISLENARLYWRSQNYAQKLERSLNDLNTAQSRFHNLVDNVPGVVYQYCMSADGILSLNYISADCYSLCEITPEQAAANAKFFAEMVYPDDMANYQRCYTDTVQTLSPWHWEGRIVTPSGIVKWIHGEARTKRQADGSIIWDGLFLDISDRKKAELALEQKSQDLQQAQLQIIQSEKMSALGNLVAGVAHEMNNPLGFIAASLKQAKPTFADLVEHLKLYQETFQNSSDEIIDHAEEIDLEYSLEDLPKMLDSMSMACDRLKNISTSLRTFSRADKDYKVPFNIHQGIDSTILILKHRLKANEQRPAIEVVTNSGDLPPIECFPGQLNQVFMNILANAIDALEESNNGRSFEEIKANPNRITITTSLENNCVKIAIADNGKGMSESVKQKIFDHLFTTKAVGKGTGLGLAIARQIVEETHSGKLSFHSVLGEGTEFLIEIPG